jgi:hypothetical protein
MQRYSNLMTENTRVRAAIRAAKAWNLLAAMAERRQTERYLPFAERLDYTHPQRGQNMSHVLQYIYDYCKANEIPHLHLLAVNVTGRAGCPSADWESIEEVFAFDWSDIVPPTWEELLAQYDEEPDEEL